MAAFSFTCPSWYGYGLRVPGFADGTSTSTVFAISYLPFLGRAPQPLLGKRSRWPCCLLLEQSVDADRPGESVRLCDDGPQAGLQVDAVVPVGARRGTRHRSTGLVLTRGRDHLAENLGARGCRVVRLGHHRGCGIRNGVAEHDVHSGRRGRVQGDRVAVPECGTLPNQI